MKNNYDVTPSYFKNCEYFNQYLGQTSYYTTLQNALASCIKRTGAQNILDLGCALGTTTFRMAGMFPDAHFCGLDMRKDIISEDKRVQKKNKMENVRFVQGDMMECATTQKLEGYDFIYMLYSFHHIPDPLESKIDFLNSAHDNLPSGAHLFIGETFIPEDDQSIEEIWKIRSHEGYASTFWAYIENGESIDLAKKAAQVSENEEREAGFLVEWRNSEYLVKRSWAADEGTKAGFAVVINEPVNAIGDGIVLLRKE